MTKSHKQKTYDRGLWAENIAKIYLVLKGYRILHSRFKSPVGEIDIIAKKQNSIIFIEVKARQTQSQALESITYKMRQRIERAAMLYCSKHDLTDTQMRFDLISVIPPLKIHHLDNAWQAQA
ncbi:MAG: YraN family protein [Pseudomonadota bacterium]